MFRNSWQKPSLKKIDRFGCRLVVSVTNLLNAKAGRMTGMRIVCPAQSSWGSRVNWVLPTVLPGSIKLILGLILPCLAALLSCRAECGRKGNRSHAQKLVLQTKPGGQLWWRRAEAAISLSACRSAGSAWEEDWELAGLSLCYTERWQGACAESGNVRFASLLLGVPVEGKDAYS